MGLVESSPRRLTIRNENQIIKITDSVAERILACNEKTAGGNVRGKKTEKECLPSETEKNVGDIENIPPDRLKYSGDALINYYYGPSITSINALQAKEKELKESETYWRNRIQNLEEKHAELKDIMEKEYSKALNEIDSQVPRPPPGTPFPCVEEKNKMLKCYNQHPKQALLCAMEVSQFADCVQNKRINSLQGNQKSC